MLNFLINYWVAVVPVIATGLILMGMAKKARDERIKEEKALVPLTVRRKQQG